MNELLFDPEPEDNDGFFEWAAKIAESMLTRHFYANLNENDFRVRDVIAPEETLEEWVARQLDFDHSIIPDAVESILDQIPPPLWSAEAAKLKAKPPALEEEEDEIRLRELGFAPRVVDTSHPEFEQQKVRFAREVVWFASEVVFEDGRKLPAETLRRDPELLEAILESGQLKTVKHDGKSYWGFTFPPLAERWRVKVGEQLLAAPSGEGEFCVLNAESNSLLSSTFLAMPNLVTQYLSDAIGTVQRQAYEQLLQIVDSVANEKYSEAFAEAAVWNQPIQIDFFQKLLADAGNNGLEILHMQRMFMPEQASGETWAAHPPQIFYPTKANRYMVERTGNSELMFRWEYADSNDENVLEDGVVSPRTVAFKKVQYAMVRLNQGKLEYAGYYDASDQLVWTAEPDSGAAVEVYLLFSDIQVLSAHELLREKTVSKDELKRLSAQLIQTRSSVEFVQLLRQLQPTNDAILELLVNKGTEPRIGIDEWRKPPASSRWN